MSAAGRTPGYVGRFAPSPTGPLHRGSLVAALASWLDARAHGGAWRVRIEDVDTTRCSTQHERTILAQLETLGLRADGPVIRQTQRAAAYERALQRLRASGRVFACACSRRDIESALLAQGTPPAPHAQRVYPGTCRAGTDGRAPRAERFRVGDLPDGELAIDWTDRRLGAQHQNVSREVGDFVLCHADGRFTYQLAVVVDDAEQGITDVVRGEDLADNTARQIALQQALGLPRPRYLHTPLVLAADGQKLSKQTGAAALDLGEPVSTLRDAGRVLGLPLALAHAGPPTEPASTGDWLAAAVTAWRDAVGGLAVAETSPRVG